MSVENGTVANLETKIRNNKQQIDYESKRRQALLSEYHDFKEKKKKLEQDNFNLVLIMFALVGQALPPEQVEEVNKKHWPNLINNNLKI